MHKTSKSVRTAAVAALVLGIGATTAVAGGFERYESAGSIKDAPAPAEGRKLEFSVNGGFTTDYVFRGFSQTQGDPAWFAGADATYGIFYAGVWASKVDQAFTSSDAEIDLYAGITPELGPATFDFGVIYYGYAGQTATVNVDYWEFKAGVSGDILPKLNAGVTYYYTPDDTFEVGPGHVVEGKLSYALPKVWIFDPTVSGLIGYKENTDIDFDYTYWNAGLSLDIEKITLDFRYWDTDVNTIVAGENISDERFVFTAKVSLP